ncbi:MAG: ribonuclease P protein component 1 [Candidatus Thorarchaeota archaeon]
MKTSPTTLTRQELLGLQTHVVSSTDPGLVCKVGTIEHESREMIHLSTERGLVGLPKKVCVFDISLTNGTVVRVDGGLLRGTPEDRLKKRQSRRW